MSESAPWRAPPALLGQAKSLVRVVPRKICLGICQIGQQGLSSTSKRPRRLLWVGGCGYMPSLGSLHVRFLLTYGGNFTLSGGLHRCRGRFLTVGGPGHQWAFTWWYPGLATDEW